VARDRGEIGRGRSGRAYARPLRKPLRRWRPPAGVAVGLALPFGLGVALTHSDEGGITGLLWGGAARALLHHTTFSINCYVTTSGGDHSRPAISRKPRVARTDLLRGGWHNNHHAFPTSARHGFGRRQPDRSAWLISGLERCHLAWDVVRISPEHVERASPLECLSRLPRTTSSRLQRRRRRCRHRLRERASPDRRCSRLLVVRSERAVTPTGMPASQPEAGASLALGGRAPVSQATPWT
jgi:hypothetical protein